MQLTRLGCCGIIEFNGIGNIETSKVLLAAIQDSFDDDVDILHHCGWVIFSQAKDGTYGEQFAAWLENEALGTVIRLPQILNENSKNMIGVFCWQVNHKVLGEWMDAHKKELDLDEDLEFQCTCALCVGERLRTAQREANANPAVAGL